MKARATVDEATGEIVLPDGRRIPWTTATAACHGVRPPSPEQSKSGNRQIAGPIVLHMGGK